MPSSNQESNDPKRIVSNKAAQPQQRHPSSKDEDIQVWVEHVKKHGADAEVLTRMLPDISEAIRNGSLEPKELPKRVRKATQNSMLAGLQRTLEDTKLGENPKVMRLGSVQCLTGAEPLLCDLVHAACGPSDEMNHKFAHYFYNGQKLHKKWGNMAGTIVMDGKKIVDVKNPLLILEVQRAYNRACEIMQQEIERLAKKPWKEHCWAYTGDPVEFIQSLAFLIYRNENFSLEDLCQDAAYTESIEIAQNVEKAARAVQYGWDTCDSQCWECGKQSKGLKRCSGCSAALYCSRDCQRKSWKTGHKAACSHLKTMYSGFKANLCRIDRALDDAEANPDRIMVQDCSVPLQPLSPAGSRDYRLMPFLLTFWTFPVVMVGLDLTSVASVDHMYKTIGDLVDGKKHWLFVDTFKGPLKEHLKRTRSSGPTTGSKRITCCRRCFFWQ